MSQPATAMDDIERLVRESGKAGMTPTQLARARNVKRPSVERPIQRLVAAGRIVNSRVSQRVSLYFVPEFAPEVLKAPPQRLTSIRDANVTMPQGEPIITEQTRITRAAPFVDRRFAFDPPPGWTGQITRDWRERRLGAQR